MTPTILFAMFSFSFAMSITPGPVNIEMVRQNWTQDTLLYGKIALLGVEEANNSYKNQRFND